MHNLNLLVPSCLFEYERDWQYYRVEMLASPLIVVNKEALEEQREGSRWRSHFGFATCTVICRAFGLVRPEGVVDTAAGNLSTTIYH